jgi:hypothetical protein
MGMLSLQKIQCSDVRMEETRILTNMIIEVLVFNLFHVPAHTHGGRAQCEERRNQSRFLGPFIGAQSAESTAQ